MATFEDVLKAKAQAKQERHWKKAAWNETRFFATEVFITLSKSMSANGGDIVYPEGIEGWIDNQEEGFSVRTIIVHFPPSSKLKPMVTSYYIKRVAEGYEVCFNGQNKTLVPSKKKQAMPIITSLFYSSLIDKPIQ